MLIALHKGKGFIAKAIQWQTRSPYSHASVVINDKDMMGVEAREFKGVRRFFKCADWAPGEQVDLFKVRATGEQELLISCFLIDQIGKPYDYTMVARFITRRQAAREESGKWFCSELVYYAFMQAGINLLGRIEPWAVSPGLLSLSPLLIPVRDAQQRVPTNDLRDSGEVGALGNNTRMPDGEPVNTSAPQTLSEGNL